MVSVSENNSTLSPFENIKSNGEFILKNDLKEIFVYFDLINEELFTNFVKKVLISNTQGNFTVYLKNKNWNKENLDLSSFLNKQNNKFFNKLFEKNTVYEICNGEFRQIVFSNNLFKRIYVNNDYNL